MPHNKTKRDFEQQSTPGNQSYNDGRDELNLAAFPIASLSTRPKKERIICENWFTDQKGEKHYQRWEVGPVAPPEGVERVYVALMAITKQQGFLSRKISISIPMLLKIMQMPKSQKNYRKVVNWLKQLLEVTIHAEGAFWDKSTQQFVKEMEGFHILEKYWFRFLEKDETTRQQSDELGYVIWSEDLWHSFQQGNIKYLDIATFYSLKLPLSRRLYRHLDKLMHYKDTYQKDIFRFANLIGMSGKYKEPRRIWWKMKPALDEVTEVGFLEAAWTQKKGRYTRIHFKKATVQEPIADEDLQSIANLAQVSAERLALQAEEAAQQSRYQQHLEKCLTQYQPDDELTQLWSMIQSEIRGRSQSTYDNFLVTSELLLLDNDNNKALIWVTDKSTANYLAGNSQHMLLTLLAHNTDSRFTDWTLQFVYPELDD